MTKGEKVKLLRTNSHMTREALAREIGYSKQMVYKIESGEKEPCSKFLNSVIRYFGVPVSFFIDEVFDELYEDIKQKDLESILLNKANLEYRGRILSQNERQYLTEILRDAFRYYEKYAESK